ncbi:NEQ498 [Nanoarchaeum equitans Kin4-M]|uniref:Probable translation initiation factor IF-2 n=1 Tax=Nanoarchaeum equitans (strain Kin4-M) TaxID=228908 RepID=Q74MW5_NANEQ|nr:NEQ498 [Nanoarchaeum equitans Kin4-M]
MKIRQPIITILGHVDHGKTTLLDKIRKTAVAQKEAGGITQHIGATEVPIEVIEKIAEPIRDILKFELKIPGLLFIDTPGHEAFSNLRKRGGSIADLAIVVIDINEGIMPQTKEAIEICKQFRVPFIIAANKIDKIPGWESREGSFIKNYQRQSDRAKQELENRVYNLVSQLYELGFESDIFFRIEDFRKTVAIVPVSAKTGEGIPELLLLTAGLAQRFLTKKLEIDENSPGKGVILEKKKDKGIYYLDVILYDGVIRKGDTIAFYGIEGPIITKVRGLFKAKPLTEIREKSNFIPVNEAHAAAGIRILTPENDKALAGSPLYVIRNNQSKILEQIKEEISSIVFEEKEGLVVKADTLGTLEAIVNILKSKGIKVSKAGIGEITKEDIIKAQSQKDEKYRVILAFNVSPIESPVPIIYDNVIYRLLEKYEEFLKQLEEQKKLSILDRLTPVAKIEIIPGLVFRRKDPAIVGVKVIGKIKPNVLLMNEEGKIIGRVKSIQKEGVSLKEAENDEVAIAIEGVTVGRQIKEGDTLYTYIREEEFKEYKKHKDLLNETQKTILKEIAQIMRKQNPTWGL